MKQMPEIEPIFAAFPASAAALLVSECAELATAAVLKAEPAADVRLLSRRT